MIGKIAAILLLCVSIFFIHKPNTRVIENLNDLSTSKQDTPGEQTGDALDINVGPGGYNNHPYYPAPARAAYNQSGGSSSVNTPGYEFYTTPRYGFNAARGGDVVDHCNKLTNSECPGHSQCVLTDGGPLNGTQCKNRQNNLNRDYSVGGYLEEQFQNGTMGAPYVRDSFKKQQTATAYNDDNNDDNDNIEQFGVKNNAAPKRGNLTKVQNSRRGDIVGALRGEVKITENFNGYCPSRQISKSLGGGQSYSCSAITGVGQDNDPLWQQEQEERNKTRY